MKGFFETTLELQEDDVPVTVEYEYHRGEPEELPRFGEAGNPGTGDSVDITSILDIDGKEYLDFTEEFASSEIDRIEGEIFARHERD